MRLFDEPSLCFDLHYHRHVLGGGSYWIRIMSSTRQLSHSYVNSGRNYLFKPAVEFYCIH